MALVMRKFKRFYKKDFNKRGKNPPFKKGGQSSSLFKASRLSQSHRKRKRSLKLEALKKKKKGKGLIRAWDQESSESEGEEKANLYFMALENDVQFSPSNSSNLVYVDDDDDLNSLLIEMYHELEKITKKNKELKSPIEDNQDSLKSKEYSTTLLKKPGTQFERFEETLKNGLKGKNGGLEDDKNHPNRLSVALN
ncbi:hypothetical protein M9H77_03365 [Catharanthus roseus]|uniref:Uncharacterized protein n=1 Tax=Catharanthus roseus TaxID=4058 RepID=A0ACC0CBA3_CATRO|nr:hypothetical protein M9H77_03365 [Catharanthus roseus]